MITRVQRLSVPVSNLERSKCFYLDALGLELVNDVPLPGPQGGRWVEVGSSRGSTTLLLVPSVEAGQPVCASRVMLETTELEGDRRRLQRFGLSVDGPHETPWGRELRVHDPDGNRIALVEAQPTAPYHASWLAWRYATPMVEDEAP